MTFERKLVFVTVPIGDLFINGKAEKIEKNLLKIADFEFESVFSSNLALNGAEVLVGMVYKAKKPSA